MYRRVVVTNVESPSILSVTMLYHVTGAVLLSQRRASSRVYDPSFANATEFSACTFVDSIRLKFEAWMGDYATYEFILYVPENQPAGESIEETTNSGVSIAVYNEHDVLVCHNSAGISAGSSPTQTESPGEMTSEPIGGHGEMTSVPGEAPGDMASEPIDDTAI